MEMGEDLESAAVQWDRFAASAAANPYARKAYQKAANAIRWELYTGQQVCCCCFMTAAERESKAATALRAE